MDKGAVGACFKELGRFFRLLCRNKFHPVLCWLLAKTQHLMLKLRTEVISEKLVVIAVISFEANRLV